VPKREIFPIALLFVAATAGLSVLLLSNLHDSTPTLRAPVQRVSTPPAGLYKIADLKPEGFYVNQGMGCTFDRTKTIEAVRRLLTAKYPDRLVNGVQVLYCQPTDDPRVIALGTLVPHPFEPEIYTPPAECPANEPPPIAWSCQPHIAPGTGPDFDRLSIAISDLAP
jgi:hypothetical protein